MGEAKVSVIVPVFNVEKYLRECLDSIIGQTYENIEIICVDDASTDSSYEILDEYQKTDTRFKIIRQERNRGLSAARNKGLEFASGKYVLFVDSDDFISLNLLKDTVVLAEKDELDELIFNSVDFSEHKDLHPLKRGMDGEETCYELKTGRDIFIERGRELGNYRIRFAAWLCLYNKEYLEKNNLRFFEGIIHEDILFFFRRCMCAKRVAIMNKPYYHYRKNIDSITTGYRDNRAKSLFIIISEIYISWLTNKYNTEVSKAIESMLYDLWLHYKKALYCGECSSDKLIVAQPIEFMYRLSNNMLNNPQVLFEKKDINLLREKKKWVLYGCGKIATAVMLYLEHLNIFPSNVVVGSHIGNPEYFAGIKVQTLEELGDIGDVPIVVGASKEFHDDIGENLNRLGYKVVVYPQR